MKHDWNSIGEMEWYGRERQRLGDAKSYYDAHKPGGTLCAASSGGSTKKETIK